MSRRLLLAGVVMLLPLLDVFELWDRLEMWDWLDVTCTRYQCWWFGSAFDWHHFVMCSIWCYFVSEFANSIKLQWHRLRCRLATKRKPNQCVRTNTVTLPQLQHVLHAVPA